MIISDKKRSTLFNSYKRSAPLRTRSTPSTYKRSSRSKRSAPSKSRSIPNEDQINKNVVRTVCIDQLPANRRAHLKGLLTISTPKHIPYTQGDNFIALELLRLHPIKDAYEIFASKGIRRFRMLSLLDRQNFVREVSPLFEIQEYSQHLTYVLASYIYFFYTGSAKRNSSSCVSKLLTVLLGRDVKFYKDTDNFVQFYFFILRHLSISVAEDYIANNGYQNFNLTDDPFSLQIFINRIEDLTLTSMNTMSIGGTNTMYNYNKDGKKYKFHIIAAYAVMLLDKLFDVDLKIDIPNILSELKYSQTLIHISQTPNLQGIRPILREKGVITFEHNVPLKTLLFAKTQRGVSKKLFVAQYMLGLNPTTISRDTPLGQHCMKIMYVDKRKRKVSTLYEAITYSSRTTILRNMKTLPFATEQPPRV